jgi:hypothetical protein
MRTLVIISCGAKKIWDLAPDSGPTKAGDAYQGIFFRLNKEYAIRFGDKWMILSAKYGFIEPEFVIHENYNATFSDPKTNPIGIEKLKNQVLEKKLHNFDIVIVLAGKEYADLVTQAFSDSQTLVIKPFEGLGGIGYMMRAVRRAIDNNSPFSITTYLESPGINTRLGDVYGRLREKQREPPCRLKRPATERGFPTSRDFEFALRAVLKDAEKRGEKWVDVISGDLHRIVGGYPGPNHRMSLCCKTMYSEMRLGDEILYSPSSGKGATLRIRYRLPR